MCNGNREVEEENRALKAKIEHLESALESVRRESTNYGLVKDHEYSTLKRQLDESVLQLELKTQCVENLEAALHRTQTEQLDQSQELIKARSDAAATVREKEILIQQLEMKLSRKEDESASSEIAVRCQKLGQALLEKQAALETRSMEVEQYQLKLRVANQKIKELELLSTPSNTTMVHRDIESQDPPDTAPYHVRNSLFLQNLSRRSVLGRNVTSFAGNVGNFTIKAARVLRRHALLRVGFVIYIVILHLWMFLFTGMVLPQGTPTVAEHVDLTNSAGK
eukprot:TRINITY_DN710_c3_g1_i1.p1 TRINITY_DN710_c3_g1~~TRINITY_DN710_c3_g1_i1.p1  ORF type:complete len:320 (+),score=48.49 TRINITY_DN710_c3_g1_i1:121-960(+)